MFMPQNANRMCDFVMHSPPTADVSGGSDGGNIGCGQLQLLHATSQRVTSPQSPPVLQPQFEYDNEVSHFELRQASPTGSDVQRKYQRMLAVVEERSDVERDSAENID